MLALLEHGLDNLLLDLALLFALCVAVVVVFHNLKVPPVAGFLLAGALLGPNSFGLVKQQELVQQLAEIGVVVLLFTVGMELSLKELLKMRRTLILGGGMQVGLTILLGFFVGLLADVNAGTAIFIGFLLTLSSTAAISKLLQDRGELGSPVGRLAMSICVAQDIAVVPMILFLPLLASGGGVGWGDALQQVGLTLVLLALITVGAWLLVPKILDLVSRTRSREVFVLTVFTLCLTAALMTSQLGLSLALGAFLVGLVISESGYHHQATSEVAPFRDALSSLFFVSIGMLFNFRVILEHPGMVVLALILVVVGKAFLVWVASRVLSLPRWVGIRSGLLLAQVGEFSFVLMQVGRGKLGMSGDLGKGFSLEDIFIVVAVLSISLTPLMLMLGRRFTRSGGKDPTHREPGGGKDQRESHVVIVGFGPTGQAVARSLRELDIPYVAIEMNAATVKAFKKIGIPIFLGDSSRETVLNAAAIKRARLLVLAMNDNDATLRTAALARRLVPKLHVVARSTYLSQLPALQNMGVHDVVPQELEASVEIVVRVLRHYLVPDDQVGKQVKAMRSKAYGVKKSARPTQVDNQHLADYVPGLGVEIFKVESGSSIAGFALQDSDLRRISGCTVVAIKRDKQTDISIRPQTVLEEGDVAVLLGPANRMGEAAFLFRAPDPVSEPAKPAVEVEAETEAETEAEIAPEIEPETDSPATPKS